MSLGGFRREAMKIIIIIKSQIMEVENMNLTVCNLAQKL